MSRLLASGDRITLANLSSVINFNAITVSIWFNTANLSFSGGYGCLFGFFDSPADHGFKFYVKSNGKLALYVDKTGGGGGNYDGSGSNTLSTNTWYNLVAQGSTTVNYSGYVNGSLDGSNNSAYQWNNAANHFVLGDDFTSTDTPLIGQIADAAVWSVALSAGELSALAAGARPFTVRPASLVGYWPLDGLQSPEPDLSGNANSGTLSGTSLAAGPPVAPFTPRWTRFNAAAAAAASKLFRQNPLSGLGGGGPFFSDPLGM